MMESLCTRLAGWAARATAYLWILRQQLAVLVQHHPTRRLQLDALRDRHVGVPMCGLALSRRRQSRPSAH
jgi:hypothetical protein|eukprot:COSAG01_NODE_7444_length_3207_cov_16.815756_3_plen_70_part_00